MASGDVCLPACTLHCEPDPSKVATSANLENDRAPNTLDDFLDGLRPGWSGRFAAAFEAVGVDFKDVSSLEFARRECLEKELQNAGAKMLHLKILWNALDALTSHSDSSGIVSESNVEIPASQSLTVQFESNNCFNVQSESSILKDQTYMWWPCKSRSVPVTPCNRLLDDCDIQFVKGGFDASLVCDEFDEDDDCVCTPKIFDTSQLPYKSPCAAYFDGCDDFSLASLSSNDLSLSFSSDQESASDASSCASTNTSTYIPSDSNMIPCATNTAVLGVCFVQPQYIGAASCTQKSSRTRFSNTIQYSYDTLTSKCGDSCAPSVEIVDEKRAIQLVDFIEASLASKCDDCCVPSLEKVDEKRALQLLDLIGASEENAETFMNGRVWQMSQDVQGCRDVQKALDEHQSTEDMQSVASQLKGHVWEAMRCPHANHVLRKVVQTMPSSILDFVIQEIVREGAAGLKQFASHRYGCRIVEELLHTCSDEQLNGMIELLLIEAEALCTHMYGNFVMKALLRHSSSAQCQKLEKVLIENIVMMGTNFYACAVLAEVLRSSSDGNQALARMIVSITGLLSAMTCHKHGRAVVEAVLLLLTDVERKAAITDMALPPLKVAKASKTLKNSAA